MNLTITPSSLPNFAKSIISSSLIPRITTTFIFTGDRPASIEASIPVITFSISSRRVISLNLSALRESMEIFTLCKPAEWKIRAFLFIFIPLVVRAISIGNSESIEIKSERFARKVGSPPVRRTLFIP